MLHCFVVQYRIDKSNCERILFPTHILYFRDKFAQYEYKIMLCCGSAPNNFVKNCILEIDNINVKRAIFLYMRNGLNKPSSKSDTTP